jgi:hypothetical protein
MQKVQLAMTYMGMGDDFNNLFGAFNINSELGLICFSSHRFLTCFFSKVA